VKSFGTLVVSAPPKEKDLVRLVLLGPLNAGKTTLVHTLQNKQRAEEEAHPSMFVRTSLASGFVGKSENLCTVKLWDIPGESRNKSISSVYCQGAACLCFVFNANDSSSFAKTKEWVQVLKMSTKTSQTRLVLMANRFEGAETEELLSWMSFAAKERMEFVTMNVFKDKGFEWKRFCWRLASETKKINFL
jgi:small GTP-binding protein